MKHRIVSNINDTKFAGYTIDKIIDLIRFDMCRILHDSHLDANKLKWEFGSYTYRRIENYVASIDDSKEKIVEKIYKILGSTFEVSDDFNRYQISLMYDEDIMTSKWPTHYDDCFKSDYHKNLFKKTDIKNVIFNGPATIVYWTDGTKTIVRCQEGDIFDPEKGLAMAITKRVLGDKGNYNDIFRKWIPKEEK